jgi:hypothetical protein
MTCQGEKIKKATIFTPEDAEIAIKEFSINEI